jgi:peptidyl-prolyl cis-trans isomerase D
MRGNAAKYIIWGFIAVTFIGGFLLYETSGLMGRDAITPNTAVATVNGEDILYTDWLRTAQNLQQQRTAQSGQPVTADDQVRIEQEAFDQLVLDRLLQQEYDRRKIGVTDAEIVAAAQSSPPPQFQQAPELQTEGRFDVEKYRRFLASPSARQAGALQQLEAYYRTEIPRQKLFQQVAAGVYVSDGRLWQIWQDTRDSAQVSFVALRPDAIADSAVRVSEAEVRAFYDKNPKLFDQPGRAVLTLVSVPRVVTAADTAAARQRAEALRAEIAGGRSFEDVARSESADSASGGQGGDLGRGARGRFVPEFETAAYALQPGALSAPVLTPFGYHIIRVDQRVGDTLALRHILVRIGQSDSSASRTDRRADSLATLAASSEDPRKFDDAAQRFGLQKTGVVAFEGEPLTWLGRVVPGASGWAFSGARVGETSELFEAPDAYYLARLDSLTQSGKQSLAQATPEIRRRLLSEKKLDALMPKAQQVAQAAASGTLEQAAQANGLQVQKSPMFTRVSLVPGLGQYTAAVGAAFGLPQGAVSAPVKTRDAVVVLRVDRRVNADKGAFEAQKAQQRAQISQALQEQRVREFMAELREQAKVEDNRRALQAAARRQSTS